MANPLFDQLFQPHIGSAAPFLFLPGGGRLSYGDFLTRAGRFAAVLRAAELAPGDRLAVQIEKSPDALAIYAACVISGVIFLPLNTAYAPAEVFYFLQDSGAKLIVCDPSKEDGLWPVAEAAGAQLATLGVDADGTFAEQARDHAPQLTATDRSGDDLAAFLYTSGTTGRSKGAMLTQNNLLSNAQTLTDAWGFTHSDVLLHALPIFHTHGLFVATNITLQAGGAMMFLPRFDAGQMISLMTRCTSMMGVPTFYTRLLDTPAFDRDLTGHMRLFISGSAPMLKDTHDQFEARTGHKVLERYGMTETNMNTSNPLTGQRRAGTVGLPLPGVEVKICDPDTGIEVPQGEIGVIEVRGPNVFKGYWNMPEKTAEELRDDGFFITGDLAQMDADGYVTIVGRGKDLIISGGFNIYPKELEMILDAQPGVLESAVIAVPHGDMGEAALAVLVRNGSGPDLDAIRAMMGVDVARFKHPRDYIVVDELPRNTMGKVQKNVMRDTYGDWFVDASGAAKPKPLVLK
ncbi:malonyl-CoA synthase [Ascidiaceihabitans sp.]|uniref:malonate--CoA ligase n=1 Tax=Ascidiaceihabitans sp. TaxID=1872644 RepID=UPI0032970BFB